MSNEADKPAVRRRNRLRSFLVTLAALAVLPVLLLCVEGAMRLVGSPSVEVTRFAFHVKINLFRWHFLANNLPDWYVVNDDFLQNQANRVVVLGNETDRPPFDRIDGPCLVETNSDGFRDGPFRPGKTPGTVRVFALGDSITFGMGVEKSRRVTDGLQALLPAGVEVMNLALRGCTAECEAAVLKRFIGYAPDLVLLQATTNDLDHSLWRTAESGGMTPLRMWALGVVARSRLLTRILYGFEGDPWDDSVSAALSDAAKYYAPSLDAIFETCRARGVKVVAWASRMAIETLHSRHVFEACARNSDVCIGSLQTDFSEPGRWVRGWDKVLAEMTAREDWVARTADAMDLDPATLGQVIPFRYLFHDIVHPNEWGHQVMAGQLAAFLKERWVPGLDLQSTRTPMPSM